MKKKRLIKLTLLMGYPEIAAEWHPTKNGNIQPSEIGAQSNKKWWWLCEKGHEWEAICSNRTNKQQGCQVCSGKTITKENSLGAIHPHLVEEWHPSKNGSKSPHDVKPNSHDKVWWICKFGHEWQATCASRTSKGKHGCSYCSGRKLLPKNSLAVKFPAIAAELHPSKNGSITAFNVGYGQRKEIWWQCPVNKEHEWMASPYNRTGKNSRGCRFCNLGWTIENIRLFIKSILPFIETLTPAGLYVLMQQSGVMDGRGKGRNFVQALKGSKFPKEELEKFVNNEPSIVDNFIAGEQNSLDDNNVERVGIRHDDGDFVFTDFPVAQTKDILAGVKNIISSAFDEEAVDFLIKEVVARIWQHAYLDEKSALGQITEYVDDHLYVQRVKQEFLHEHEGARSLKIPRGYSFQCEPNLMQRRIAFLVKDRRRVGNWSGTGAGKTLSAILASRVIGASLTVICCPNSVVDNWRRNILDTYPDSVVIVKDVNIRPNLYGKSVYVILNYEFFQTSAARVLLKSLVDSNNIDFVVIDEVHYAK